MATITAGAGIGISSSSDSSESPRSKSSDATSDFELHFQFSLPSYHWQQCLHLNLLRTREEYYMKGRAGMKAKEEPRMTGEFSGEFYPEDDRWYEYDSEGSSSDESSSANQKYHQRDDQNDQVLVVAGCKSCIMYFMVLKQIQRCPKCSDQLLHFDRSANVSSS